QSKAQRARKLKRLDNFGRKRQAIRQRPPRSTPPATGGARRLRRPPFYSNVVLRQHSTGELGEGKQDGQLHRRATMSAKSRRSLPNRPSRRLQDSSRRKQG